MEYKSPIRKLLHFFEKSRNNWKGKTLQTKQELKLAKNRIVFLEESKAALKDENKILKEKVKVLEARCSLVEQPPPSRLKKNT